MKRCQRAWVIALVLACAGCVGVAPIGADSDYDSSANFTSYESFGWLSDKPLLLTDATLTSPQFQGRAMKAIRESLEARGYRFEADVENADFAVAFTLGTREQIRVNAYPAQYEGTWTWGGPVPQGRAELYRGHPVHRPVRRAIAAPRVARMGNQDGLLR